MTIEKEEQLKYVVARLLDNARDIKEQREKFGKDDFSDGQLSATYAMLDTMKSQLIIDDIDLKEFGLDIDLEKALS